MKVALSRRTWWCVGILVSVAALGYFGYREYERRQKLSQLCERIAQLREDAGYPPVSVRQMDPHAMIPDLIVIRTDVPSEPILRRTQTIRETKEWGSGFAQRAEVILDRIDPNWIQRSEARSAILPLTEKLATFVDLTRLDREDEARNEYGKDQLRKRKAIEQTLDEIDPKWRTSPEVRAGIPTNVIRMTQQGQKDKLGWPLDEGYLAEKVLWAIDPNWEKLPEARAAIPKLAERLLDREPEVREKASRVLSRIDREWATREEVKAIVPQFLMAIKDEDAWYREDVVVALEKIGGATREAIPSLIVILGGAPPERRRNETQHWNDLKSKWSREAAEKLLNRVDKEWVKTPEARSTIPKLVNRYTQEKTSDHEKGLIISVLKRFGPEWPNWEEGRSAKADLIRGLTSSNVIVRLNSIWAIGQMGPAAKEAIPKLILLLSRKVGSEEYGLSSYGGETHAAAARAIARMGSDAKEAVPHIAALLKSADSPNAVVLVKVVAAEALAELGPIAVAALPELRRQLIASKGDKRLQALIVTAIGKIGSASEDAVPELAALLESRDDDVAGLEIMVNAANALGDIGPGAKAAIPALIGRLADGKKLTDLDSQAIMKSGYSTYGDPRELTEEEALAKRNSCRELLTGKTLRAAAAKALAAIDPSWRRSDAAKGALPRFLDRLADPVPERRSGAVAGLNQLDPKWRESDSAHAAVRKYTAILAAPPPKARTYSKEFSEDQDAREKAAYLLGQLGPLGKKALPDLILLLENEAVKLRLAAVWALGELAGEAAPAINPLIARMVIPAEVDAVRGSAAESLRKINPAWAKTDVARKTLSQLIEKLGDPNHDTRGRSARAIGLFEADGKAAIPKLISLLGDPRSHVWDDASKALDSVDNTWPKSAAAREAVPLLLEQLAKSRNTRDHAFYRGFFRRILTKVDPEWQRSDATRQTVLRFLKQLADFFWEKREESRFALDEIIPSWRESEPARQSIPALLKQLEHKEPGNRIAAAGALRIMCTNSRGVPTTEHVLGEAVVRKLVECLPDESTAAETAISQALENLFATWGKNPAAHKVVLHEIGRLESKDAKVRASAARTLAIMSPAAKDAIPALILRLDDKDTEVVRGAIRALGKMGASAKGAIPKLKRLREDSKVDEAVRIQAKLALEEIDSR